MSYLEGKAAEMKREFVSKNRKFGTFTKIPMVKLLLLATITIQPVMASNVNYFNSVECIGDAHSQGCITDNGKVNFGDYVKTYAGADALLTNIVYFHDNHKKIILEYDAISSRESVLAVTKARGIYYNQDILAEEKQKKLKSIADSLVRDCSNGCEKAQNDIQQLLNSLN